MYVFQNILQKKQEKVNFQASVFLIFFLFFLPCFPPFLGCHCQKLFHSVLCQKIIKSYFLFIILFIFFFKISNDTVFLSESNVVSLVLVDM